MQAHQGFRPVGLNSGTGKAAFSRKHRLAPDPQQLSVNSQTVRRLRELRSPTIIGWAVGTHELDRLKAKADAAAWKATVTSGSRQRPDGRTLHWRVLNLDGPPPLFPFFIEWSADSPHPSTDAPPVGTAEQLVFETPDPEQLRKALIIFEIAASIREGPVPRIRLTLATKKGRLEIA
jgi:hypothetical protein